MDNTLIKNKKILITGSNSRFAKALRNTFYGNNIVYTDRKELNILNLNSINKCLDKNKPTHLIHLASLSRPMIVHEKDISSSIDANIIGTANIVKKCSERDIKLIFFSTNYIYPGTKGNYKEDDALKPINNYAWSKLGGESSVKLYKNSLVLRLAMTEYPFIHDKAFTDAKINFIYREEVIKMLPYLLDEKGIINIGSDITESVFSFAKKTKKDVKPISVKNIKDFPKNSSININKLKSILRKKKQLVTDRKNLEVLKKNISKISISNKPSVTQLEREIVDDMMRFGWDNFGYLKKFETEFAKYHNKKYCLLLPSFKMVTNIVLKLINISKKEKNVIADLCDKTIIECVNELKIKKNYVKINKNNFLIDLNDFNKKIKAILVGDLFGNISHLEKIKNICKKNKTILIEDISDSLGQKHKSFKSGDFGDIIICNFSKDKVITCGEGGALITNNKKIFLDAKKIRDERKLLINDNSKINLYFKPTNLQSAMIYGQFKRVNDIIQNKKRILNTYQKNFLKFNVKLFGSNSIFIEFAKKYNIKINSLINYLEKNGILVDQISQLNNFHLKKLKRNLIILPSSSDLKNDQINFISKKIKIFLERK